MIPGWLISILTFPGVIAHEVSHEWFCRLLGVRVFRVCYFRLGRHAGFVEHEIPSSTLKHVIIALGPLLGNTLMGAAAATLFWLPSFRGTVVSYVSLWLGVSIAMHAFPSTGDAASLWRGLWTAGASILGRLLAAPVVLIIYVGALGSVFWLDLAYGVAVAVWVSRVLIDAAVRIAGMV